MPDLDVIETVARYRAQEVIVLLAARGERTGDLEEDAFTLFLALEKHKAEQPKR